MKSPTQSGSPPDARSVLDADQFLHSLLGAAADGVVVANSLGNIVSWNAAAETMFGYPVVEVIGRSLSLIMPAPWRDSHLARMRRVCEGGESHVIGTVVELTALRKSGEEFPIELSLGMWGSGEESFFCGIIRDISDRKRVEESARESAKMYRQMVENATLGVYRSSPDGTFLHVNAAMVKMLGYGSKEELMAVNVGSLYVHPEDRSVILSQLVGSDRVSGVKIEWLRQNGTPLFVRVSGSIIRDGAGAIDGFEMIAEDVTELSRAQALLRRQAAGLDAAVNGIVVTDRNGTIEWVNPAFTEMTGYSLEEAVGMNPRFLKSGNHDETYYGELWSTILAGGKWRGELVNRRKDGRLYTEEMTIAPVLDEAGEVVNFIAIKQDVTERVRARTAEKKALRAAEEMARAKGSFLANMSHEIRTPMNGVLGMIELLLDTTLDQEQREAAELVRESADTLLTLLNQVLDFSKVEAGQLELENAPFNLPGLVDSTARVAAARAFDRGIELACDVAADVPVTVMGDPGRLRQVLNNLIGNALKFTDAGEVVVAVRSAVTDGNSRVAFSVVDTGIGIAPDKLALVFEQFTQADSSTTRKYGGTGLGLAIARKIVEEMGGELTVTSEVGRGSVFTFDIPCTIPLAGAGVSLAADLSTLSGAHILIVDDNATNRKIVSGMLAPFGRHTVEADSSGAAWELMRHAAVDGRPFDAAIIDGHMPGEDGFDLAVRVRGDPSLAGIRLMILTSGGSVGDGKRCRELGISAYLSKPVNRVDFLDAAAALLGSPQGGKRGGLITRHSIAEARTSLEILLVEDNVVNQKVAEGLLTRRGHRVTVVGNGSLAVEKCLAGGYDVILMDIEMPVMDGVTATHKIRASPDGVRARILALTAHAMAEQQAAIMAEGFDGFLSKPFKPAELFHAVETEPGNHRRLRLGDCGLPAVGREPDGGTAGELPIPSRVEATGENAAPPATAWEL